MDQTTTVLMLVHSSSLFSIGTIKRTYYLFALGSGSTLLIKIGEINKTGEFNYSANESVNTVWGGKIMCCA